MLFYSSQFVCVSVCLFVTTLTVSSFIHGPKIRYHRLLYDEFFDFDSRILLNRLCSRGTCMGILSSLIVCHTKRTAHKREPDKTEPLSH